eukprot:comp23613_c0_seq1/m.40171 comp23613_c0_seq1/g.40171  ORF comp23613_c0_seq1/g.40171 comp23613_c0_seq1/m.40171 type:complete len:1003 (-) comp23613_c0_seq1:513-3521(-)
MVFLMTTPRGWLITTSKTTQLRLLATKAGKQGKKGGAKKASSESSGPKYDHTINLPRTSFPMRASCSEREPQIQAERCVAGVYEWQKKNNTGSEFVLHDGPPFANGVPHVGHALNKVLKDMIVRYKVMRGHRVHYVPGWDCHGLPIEQKVLASVNRKALTPSDIRRRAREFAMRAIDDQRKQFMRWGILGEWGNPYITMDPKYEANQLGVFYKMYKKGIVYQAFKPVYWSPSSGTALAEAELEYADNHVSQSVFVKFPLQQLPAPLSTLGLPHVHAVIWTTTPWTLPANQAVAVNPNEKYVVASGPQSPDGYIVVTQQIPQLEQLLGGPLKVHCELPGSDLVGSLCAHPIHHHHTSRILPADFVTTDSGTGLVHMAPAHGQEDFGCCSSNDIALGPSMVDDDGKFTEAAGKTLHGLEVLGQGQGKVIDALRHKNLLLGEAKYLHRYPYDWRSKQPVIVRATQQWFGRVGGDLRDAAEQALQSVNMVPAVGRNRLIGTLETRDDWCLSRQRVWGVPIPVFYAQGTREPLINEKTIEHLQGLVAQRGTDVWWEEDADNLLPEEYRGKGYQKGLDTMDVWFDSGTSWATVINREDGSQVADVYLEGSDQHRGWFQSSLLTSVAATGSAPFLTVICHGFVLDEQGRKMSKSIGNVVDPDVIVSGGKDAKKEPAMGADTLRLWVASTDYTSDVTIGTSILANTVEALRKLRNTARFLLGNLDGFEYPAHAVSTNEMLDVDRYILTTVKPLVDEVTQAYDSYNYSKVVRLLNAYVANELSAFYFELLKDRLYEEGRSSTVRRSAQTALFHLTDSLARLMAPIVPHLADDIWMHFPSHPLARQQSEDSKSIFQTGWVKVDEEWQCAHTVERWTMARALRGHVNRLIEGARNDKTIRASLEATIDIYAPQPVYDMLQHIHGSEASSTTSQLTDLFGVSCATLHPFTSFPTHLPPGATLCTLEFPDGQQHQVGLTLAPSTQSKCPRCWKRAAPAQDALCGRCEGVVKALKV